MSASQDFSRRFFAEFIAMRIRAWKLNEREDRAAGVAAAQDAAPASNSPGTADAAAIEARRGLIPRLGTPGL